MVRHEHIVYCFNVWYCIVTDLPVGLEVAGIEEHVVSSVYPHGSLGLVQLHVEWAGRVVTATTQTGHCFT